VNSLFGPAFLQVSRNSTPDHFSTKYTSGRKKDCWAINRTDLVDVGAFIFPITPDIVKCLILAVLGLITHHRDAMTGTS
jgi:hypothetical protein